MLVRSPDLATTPSNALDNSGRSTIVRLSSIHNRHTHTHTHSQIITLCPMLSQHRGKIKSNYARSYMRDKYRRHPADSVPAASTANKYIIGRRVMTAGSCCMCLRVCVRPCVRASVRVRAHTHKRREV